MGIITNDKPAIVEAGKVFESICEKAAEEDDDEDSFPDRVLSVSATEPKENKKMTWTPDGKVMLEAKSSRDLKRALESAGFEDVRVSTT